MLVWIASPRLASLLAGLLSNLLGDLVASLLTGLQNLLLGDRGLKLLVLLLLDSARDMLALEATLDWGPVKTL